MAVKVTELPAQMGFALATMETLTGSRGLTVIVTAFEVAGLPVAQVSLEVSSTVTTSLSTRADVAKVALFVPTGLVPMYH